MAVWHWRQSQMDEGLGPHTKQKIKRVSGIELFLELETLPSPLREHLTNELKSVQNRVETAERKLESAELIIRDLEERLASWECRWVPWKRSREVVWKRGHLSATVP